MTVPVFGVSVFQSTLSVRRATGASGVLEVESVISIHALRKESDSLAISPFSGQHISIHALRKESDFCGSSKVAYL